MQDRTVGQPELTWVSQILLCGKSEFAVKSLTGWESLQMNNLGGDTLVRKFMLSLTEVTKSALPLPFGSFLCSVLPGIL